jgi:hypothetical protein
MSAVQCSPQPVSLRLSLMKSYSLRLVLPNTQHVAKCYTHLHLRRLFSDEFALAKILHNVISGHVSVTSLGLPKYYTTSCKDGVQWRVLAYQNITHVISGHCSVASLSFTRILYTSSQDTVQWRAWALPEYYTHHLRTRFSDEFGPTQAMIFQTQ